MTNVSELIKQHFPDLSRAQKRRLDRFNIEIGDDEKATIKRPFSKVPDERIPGNLTTVNFRPAFVIKIGERIHPETNMPAPVFRCVFLLPQEIEISAALHKQIITRSGKQEKPRHPYEHQEVVTEWNALLARVQHRELDSN